MFRNLANGSQNSNGVVIVDQQEEYQHPSELRNSIGVSSKKGNMKLKGAISTGDTIFKQVNSGNSGGGGKSSQTMSTAYSVGTASSATQKNKFGTFQSPFTEASGGSAALDRKRSTTHNLKQIDPVDEQAENIPEHMAELPPRSDKHNKRQKT